MRAIAIARLPYYDTLLEMCLTHKSDGLLGFHQFLAIVTIRISILSGGL